MVNVKPLHMLRDDTPPPMEQVAVKEVSVDKVIVDGLIAINTSKVIHLHQVQIYMQVHWYQQKQMQKQRNHLKS